AATGWVDGQLERPVGRVERTHALLSVLLELPPPAYEAVVASLVAATAERAGDDAERFRAAVRGAMARFPLPQWQRLVATFERAQRQCAEPGSWS
ncbi:MAG: hypothetical protein M3P83_09855, partial [Actinomycetota bacterium]|nr:hypothetical protein [Actinomycetota bacterium]